MKTDNELIAEFLGWQRTERGGYMVPNLYSVASPDYSTGETEFNGHEFEFDMQWNWLMPVIEKIEQTGAIIEIRICLTFECSIWKKERGWDHHRVHRSEGIKAVFNAAVSYIKWYNSQQV